MTPVWPGSTSESRVSHGLRRLIDRALGDVPGITRGEPGMRDVVRGASVAFLLKVVAAGLSFGVNIILARLLGATGAGVYYLALTVTSISVVVGRLGLDNALLRFSAAAASKDDWDRVAGLYRTGMGISASVAVAATLIVVAVAPALAAHVFHEPELTLPLRIMAMAIVPMCLLTLHGELLKSLHRIRDAMLVQSVGLPALHAPMLLFLAGRYGVAGAAVSYAISSLLVLAFGYRLWRGATPQLRQRQGAFETRRLLATSIPLFWVASLNLVMGWTDTTMLGIWQPSSAVGQYGVAVRTALLTGFILVSVNSVIAPRFATLYAAGDMQTLGSVARRSTRMIALLAAPILLIFVLIPGTVLSLFGAEFRAGATALRILAAGQFVNAACGSVGYLLMMSGHEKVVRDNVLMAAILNLAGNAILIPRLGITGAAIATSASIAIQNLAAVWLVRRHLRIRMW